MNHLGSRVSALLDGQLAPEETERAWAHVHQCHQCRDLVEREGWIKTRLAGLAFDGGSPPMGLKASLLAEPWGASPFVPPVPERRTKRTVGLVALGGGAAGAAVMGVLALGAAPADAPNIERRAPVSSVLTPSPAPARLPATIRR